MAEFVVNTDSLRSCASRMSILQKEVDSVASRLAAMQLGNVLQVKASDILMGTITDCKWAAIHQSDDLGSLACGMQEIAELYDVNENNLTEPKTQSMADALEEESGNILSDIAEWINDAIPGELLDFVGEFVDNFVEGFGDVTTVIQRVLQNLEEFGGDLLDPRFWAEFGLESLIDIGKGMLIGAGMAIAIPAILAAAGVSVGAIGTAGLVALGTVAVSWGIDVIYELISGNEGGITEWISDNIIDTAVEAGTKAIEAVKDGAVALWDGIVGVFA